MKLMKWMLALLLLVFAVPTHAQSQTVQSSGGTPLLSAVTGGVIVAPGGFIPMAATTNSCGSAAHCTILNWTETTPCTSPCTMTFNVLRGTSSGGESATPINSSALTALTYTDPITLTSAQQTFYYEVEAVETSGTIVQTATSAEVSATFPAILIAPSAAVTVQ